MKFKSVIALILAIWLPLLSGNEIAVALSMESCCQMHTVHKQSMATEQHAGNMLCHACGFCHLAGTGYIAMSHTIPDISDAISLAPSFNSTEFSSITSPPLVPPPLASL